MPSCCSSDDYDSVFTTREAAAKAQRYRRRGLTGTALDLATAVGAVDTPTGSILEIGGGIGEIHLALLERDAAIRAQNVELSRNWETEAQKLIDERNLGERVERLFGDFVYEARRIPVADTVILHRVVCCYPDWRAMLEAATTKADRILAMTFPVDRWWVKAMGGLGNQFMRLRRESYRGFVHPADAMLGLVRAQGFEISSDRSGFVWRTVIALRS